VASQGDEQDELDPDIQAAAPWRADERSPERWAHHGESVASETAAPDTVSGEKAHWFAARKKRDELLGPLACTHC